MGGRWIVGFAVGAACVSLALASTAQAARWEGAAGYSMLDEPSYSFLGYRTALGFDLGEPSDPVPRSLVFHLGATHPYEAHAYSQVIARAGATLEYELKLQPWAAVFGGLGAGAYMDRVQNYGGETVGSGVPAVILRGGFRAGGKRAGAVLGVDDYSGIFTPWHLPFIIWHHFSFTGGIYVRL